MTKNFKLVLSLALAIMVFAISVPFALAEGGYTITINNSDQLGKHTYSAYKIFAGTLNAEKNGLGDVTWADTTAGSNLLTAIASDETLGTVFTGITTAQGVAEKLNDLDSAQLERFAELAGEKFTTVAGTSTEDTTPYTIEVSTVGYYLVKDSGTVVNGDSKTSIILKVVGDATVNAKSVTVPNEKKIVAAEDDPDTTGTNEEELVDSNTAAVGDTVNYVVTSKIPSMEHYEKYYFIVHDTMSDGLTFDGTVTAEYGHLDDDDNFVKDGDIPAASLDVRTKDTTDKPDTGDTFTCVVKDALNLFKDKTGKIIRFHYSATINQGAVIGNAGNWNKDSIEYSNNPNKKGEGENKPGQDETDITGKTGEDQVITYIAGLEILKIDGTTKLSLAGAKFTVTANELNQVKKVVKTSFVKDNENGTYYKLIDGSYTETAPDTATLSDAAKAKYAEPKTDKYKSETTTTWETVAVPASGDKVTGEYTVGDDGVLHLEGLNAGTYTIHETEAPTGYNLLTDDIVVRIYTTTPSTVNATTDTTTWNYTTKVGSAAESEEKTAATAIATVTIENNQGATLPSTGGVGTTIFYVAGSIMVLAAAILLITKRRMGAND